MKEYRKQNDDRGFTLVELLVAIVVLAIVVVPLLHTFVSSARTNMRARQILRVTTAAQDIMEGLKADTIEEIAYQYNFPTHDFHIINQDMVNGNIREVLGTTDPTSGSSTYTPVAQGGTKETTTASIYSEDGGTTYEFLGQKEGKYYFVMTDVTLQRATFDALIELDATNYREGGLATDLHNDQEVVDISAMDPKCDAFYVQEELFITTVLQKMNAKYNPTTPIVLTDLKQKIEINVDTTVTGGQNLTKATIIYNFESKSNGEGMTTPYTYSEEHTFFNNVESKQDLQNVYLFYYPLYTGGTDEIIYNNGKGTGSVAVPAILHIIKQEPGEKIGLQAKEDAYRCKVSINESATGGAEDSLTKIRTNLNTNLYDNYSLVELSKITQASYYYNGGPTDETKLGIKELSGKEKIDRIFDITIRVYEPGAAANNFPEDDRLTTVTGSKNN